jgi:pimeloyl-ACP methyl ester carboxylesterase
VIDRRAAITGTAVAAMMTAFPARAALAGHDDSLSLADGRPVPLRIWQPAGKPKSLIAFSHGANSRPDKYDRLFAPLAAAGHLVVAPLHADTPDHPGGGKIAREDGIPMRMADMRGVLAQYGKGVPQIAAGHSYGGMIAQMFGGAAGTAPEPVKAVVAWSPPGPFPPGITAETWKTMARPQLVVTGTADVLPVMAPTWDVHRVSFDVAPGPSVLFVGAGVDHYFGNIICRPERSEAPQPAQFDDAVTVTLAFIAKALAGKSFAPLARPPAPGKSWIEVKA